VLLSGHASGELRLHTLLQAPPLDGAARWEDNGDLLSEQQQQLQLALSQQVLPPAETTCSPLSTAAGVCGAEEQAAAQQGSQERAAGSCAAPTLPVSCAPVVGIEGQGRGGKAASTALVYDAAGRLAVLKQGCQAFGQGADVLHTARSATCSKGACLAAACSCMAGPLLALMVERSSFHTLLSLFCSPSCPPSVSG
jgi:hypothetical protein